MGCFDDRREIEALLQDPLRTLLSGDGGDVLRRGADVDAEACEGEERLQDVAIEVFGDAFHLIEEACLRHGFVAKIWDGELAHAEEPVGVAGPLDVEIVGEAEMQVQVLAFEFVHDDAVVDAADGNRAAVAFVEELPAFFSDVRDVDGWDAEGAFR